jgi:hypothetical protein
MQLSLLIVFGLTGTHVNLATLTLFNFFVDQVISQASYRGIGKIAFVIRLS